MGVTSKPGGLCPIPVGNEVGGNETEISGRAGTSSFFLGRIPRCASPNRVLAGSRESPSRSFCLHAPRGQHLEARTLGAVIVRCTPDPPVAVSRARCQDRRAFLQPLEI